MLRHFVLSSVLAIGVSGAAISQSMAQSMAPASGSEFRRMAMMSDSFEIESSRLALQKSRNPRIRSFANMMLRDHSMTTAALSGGDMRMSGGPVGSTAAGAGIGFLAGGPVGAVVGAGVGATAAAAGGGRGGAPQVFVDARHADMLNQLAAAQGRQFDALYVSMQVAAHQEAIGLFSAYAQGGRDQGLANFAGQTLPTLQHHYAMAARLAR